MNLEFKSQLQSIEDVEKRNKKFHSLSDIDKKKEIAYDSLCLLIKGNLYPARTCYWDNNLKNIYASNSNTYQKRIIRHSEEEPCFVCGRGAVMLSTIRLGNRIDANELFRSKGRYNIVQGFNMREMSDIEQKYEHHNFPYASNTKESLINILLQIITTGCFSLQDDTDYLKYQNYEITNTTYSTLLTL